MSPEAVVTIIVGLFGGGTVATIINGIRDRRKGVDEAKIAHERNALDGFRELTDDLREEISRLRESRDADAQANEARFKRIEAEIAVERDLKWTAIQHIRSLYSWIAQHLPGSDPPPPPDALSSHITYPRKDQSS